MNENICIEKENFLCVVKWTTIKLKSKQNTRLQIATTFHFKIEIINYHNFRHYFTICQQSFYCVSFESLTTWLYVETLLILRSNIHMITFKSQKSNIYSNNWQLTFDWIFLLQLQLQHCCNFYCNIYTKIF